MGKYPTLRSVCIVLFRVYHNADNVLLPLPGYAATGLMHMYHNATLRENCSDDEVSSYVSPQDFVEIYFSTEARLGGVGGRCYITWLRQLRINVVLQARIVESLGSYPLFKDLVLEILKYVSSIDLPVSCPRRVGPRMLHVDPRYPTVRLCDIMWAKGWHRFRVGAEELPENAMSLYMKMCGMSHDEVVTNVLTDALRHDPVLKQRVLDAHTHKVNQLLLAGTEKLLIKYALSDEDKNKIIIAYPMFKLEWSRKPVSHPHAVSAAARVCETQYALTMLGYNSKKRFANYVALIKDVGGKPETHVHRGRLNVHTCAPILDHRDDQRHSKSVDAIAQIVSDLPQSQKRRMHKLLRSDESSRALICHRRGQQCPITAKYCMFIHSTYDMTVLDIADTLASANADGGVIAVLYNAEMLVKESGYLTEQRCYWNIITRRVSPFRTKKFIRFSFDNDSSFTYEHSYEEFVKLFATCALRSRSGVLYYAEITNLTLDTAFIQLTRSKYSVTCASTLRRCLFFPDSDKRVVIHSYRYHPEGSRLLAKPHFTPINIIVRERMYNMVMSYAYDQTASRFSVAQIFSYAKSVNVRRVTNGTAITEPSEMNATDLFDFAVAVFIMTFDLRYAANVVAKSATDEALKARDSAKAGIFKLIFDKLVSLFVENDAPIVVNPEVNTSVSLYTRLRLLFTYDRVLKVGAESMVRVIDVATWLPPHVMDYIVDREPLLAALYEADVEKIAESSAIARATAQNVAALVDRESNALDVPVPNGTINLTAGGVVSCAQCTNQCKWRPTCTDLCRSRVDELMRAKRVDVKGDGNCFYYALINALDMSIGVEDLKKLLLESDYAEEVCGAGSELHKLLTTDFEFADNSVFNLSLFVLRIRIELLIVSSDDQNNEMVKGLAYSPTGIDNCRSVQLMLKNQHYTVLKHDTVTERMVVERFTFKDFLGALFDTLPLGYAGVLRVVLHDGVTFADFCHTLKVSVCGDMTYDVDHAVVVLEFVGGVVELIHGSMEKLLWILFENYVYSRIDKTMDQVWDESRMIKHNPTYKNRSAAKFAEILAKYALPVMGKRVLDLGGAPGGVYIMVRNMNPKTIRSYSSPTGLKYFAELRNSNNVVLKDIEHVTFEKRWDVVLSDLGAENSYRWDDSDKLFRLQLEKTLEALDDGGAAVIKHHNYLSLLGNFSQLVEVFSNFDNVIVEKPYLANPNTTEVYVVLVGKRKDKLPGHCYVHGVDLAVRRILGGATSFVRCLIGEKSLPANASVLRDYTRRIACAIRSLVPMEPLGEAVKYEASEDALSWYADKLPKHPEPVPEPVVEEQPKEVERHGDNVSELSSINLSLVSDDSGNMSERVGDVNLPIYDDVWSMSSDSGASTEYIPVAEPLTKRFDAELPAVSDAPVLNVKSWSVSSDSGTSTQYIPVAEPLTRRLDIDDKVVDLSEESPAVLDGNVVTVCKSDGLLRVPECDAHQWHQHIELDLLRSSVESRQQVHNVLCQFFAINQDYHYFQGLHLFVAILLEVYEDVDYCDELSRLFSGPLETLLVSEMSGIFLDSLFLQTLRSLFPEAFRDGADLVMCSMWQKLSLSCMYDLVKDWEPQAKRFLLTAFRDHGVYAVYPIMRYVASTHKGSAVNILLEDYLGGLYRSKKREFWFGLYAAGIKNLSRNLQFADGKVVSYRKTSTCKSVLNGFKRLGRKLSGEKERLSMPKTIGRPYRTVVNVKKMRSEVTHNGKLLFQVKPKDYGHDPVPVMKVDSIDKVLLEEAAQPVKEVLKRYVIPELAPQVKQLDLPSVGTDIANLLATDTLTLETPCVMVCSKDVLIRDLLVVLADVQNVSGALSEYRWHSWLRNADLCLLENKVKEQMVRLGELREGAYACVHMGNDDKDRRFLIVVCCTKSNRRGCLVNFITKFLTDVDKFKTVPILQTKHLTCARMHNLLRETLSQNMKHRYKRIVEDFCSDDEVFRGATTPRCPLNEATKIMHDNWADKGIVEYKYNFRPETFPITSTDGKVKNAVAEIMEYWRVAGAMILNNCIEYHSRMRLHDARFRASMAESAEGYAVYDSKDRKWLVKSIRQEPAYEYCCDGSKMVLFKDATKSRADIASRYLLVGTDTVLMQDSKLFLAAKKLVPDLTALNFENFTVTLVSGVPGCGKTTEAINNFVLPKAHVKGDLILFPTKVAALDFRDRLQKKNSDLDDNTLRRHVMTIDSFLINDPGYPAYNKLIIDEALMLHCGAIFIAALKAHVQDIYLIGDVKQIPWVNRTPLKIVHHLITDIVTPAKYLSVSYRCTVSTAALLSPLYKAGMWAYGTQTGDMSYRVDANPLMNHINKDAHYLVYTQGDKKEFMSKNPGLHVNTIHEYQGKEHNEIVLIRGSAKNLEIYFKQPYNLVALSRHRKKFLYVTPTMIGDELVKQIARVNSMSGPDLMRFSKLSGGYLPADVVITKLDRVDAETYDDALVSCTTRYGVMDLTPEFPESVTVDEMDYVAPVRKVGVLRPSVQRLQTYYDHIFPGNSTHDMRYDPYHVLHSPLECSTERTIMDPSYVTNNKQKKYDHMVPALRTSIAVNRPNNQIESLLGMIKRNQAAPKLLGLQDSNQMADILVQCFCETYIRKDCRQTFAAYPDDPIECDPSAVLDWLNNQPTGTAKMIERFEAPHETDLTKYNYMIKNKVKPQLDVNAPFVYSAVQTIAYQKKNINVLFCPIFRYMRRRLSPIMKKKFVIYTDMSPDEFATTVRRNVGPDVVDDTNFLEVDISKYDKSQSRVVLLFECELMRRFGVPDYWVELWWNAHESTTLIDKDNHIRCDVDYQRKSGDASTFFGNTVFLMALMASLYDLNKVDFGCFAGDDSLLVGGPDLIYDYSSQCADLFNLESKFLRCYTYKAFCSKFLLKIDREVMFVPDPVKLLTKLGRHDIVNPQHLEEFRVSMVDITSQYGDARVCYELAKAVSDRYHITVDTSPMIESLYLLFQDPKLLREFFALPESGLVSTDTILPKFD